MDKVIKEKFKSIKVALNLQAKEYERRLQGLNHEAEQLKDMQSKYVSREVFDRVTNELKDKIFFLNEYKTKNEGRSSLIQFIPWILTAISLFFLYQKSN